tara:strand:- start:423 stop:710 length:288 start_codon:yes stop_codon:yes gene_type:complete
VTILEKIAELIKEKIESASEAQTIGPSILFCGCNHQIKKDMHKRAKSLGLKPAYSIKHPTIKVELQNNKKIEIDKWKTIIMDYEYFDFICRYLES